jgi:hypothetical protein
MPRAVFRVIATAFMLSLGCGQGVDSEPVDHSRVCEPYTGYSCVRGECNGYQNCLEDGSGWTPCVCLGTSGGSAGKLSTQPDDDGGVPESLTHR